MATDAFGRLRTSGLYTTFEYYPTSYSTNALSGIDNDLWKTDNSGSSAVDANTTNLYIYLRCSGLGKVTRQTKLPMLYQPGKSRLFYMSLLPLSRAKVSGDTFEVRAGNFSLDSSNDPNEGFYFMTDGDTLNWVYCYNGSKTTVSQTSWNIDTFDGSGPSGLTLNISSMEDTILLVIDQEWLGVGRVRVGFNLNGVNYYAHQFLNTQKYAYTTTPRLPLVYQIDASAVVSDLEMRQICCTSLSEGGFTPLGNRVNISTDLTGTTMSSSSTKYVILALRIQRDGSGNPIYPSGIIKILQSSGFYPDGNSTQWAKFELQIHSTVGSVGSVTGTETFSSVNKSVCEYYQGDGTQTISSDGFVITSEFIPQRSLFDADQNQYTLLLNRCQLSQYDTLYLIGSANSNGDKMCATIDFIENP